MQPDWGRVCCTLLRHYQGFNWPTLRRTTIVQAVAMYRDLKETPALPMEMWGGPI